MTTEEEKTTKTPAYYAPGSNAEHAQGILYQGDFQNEFDGTGVAIRLNARALAGTGVPVLLKPFNAVVQTQRGSYEPLHVAGIPDAVRAEVGELTKTSISGLFPSIRHFVIHKPEDISKRLMRGVMGPLENPEILMKAMKSVYGGTVLYSVWERDRIDDRMVRELSRVGDNWVPCNQNREMLQSCGVSNVFVIPHPYDPESPLLHLTRRKPIKAKRFYWIGRWEPRKNPVMILEQFCAAFRPGDDVHLTMKFHGEWAGYPTFAQTLAHIEEDFPEWNSEAIKKHITPIEGFLRSDQLVKLHFENNIYVAPSAGEAWCLPAFEAKLAGNTLIYSNYGGMRDFADVEGPDRVVESTGLSDVPASYGWPAGSQWSNVVAQHLRMLFETTEAPREYVRPKFFEESFSLGAVGSLMRKRLAQVFGSSTKGGYLL